MYKYRDAVQETQRVEAREIRDEHFLVKADPMRLAVKLELKKRNKHLNRGYKPIKI